MAIVKVSSYLSIGHIYGYASILIFWNLLRRIYISNYFYYYVEIIQIHIRFSSDKNWQKCIIKSSFDWYCRIFMFVFSRNLNATHWSFCPVFGRTIQFLHMYSTMLLLLRCRCKMFDIIVLLFFEIMLFCILFNVLYFFIFCHWWWWRLPSFPFKLFKFTCGRNFYCCKMFLVHIFSWDGFELITFFLLGYSKLE